MKPRKIRLLVCLVYMGDLEVLTVWLVWAMMDDACPSQWDAGGRATCGQRLMDFLDQPAEMPLPSRKALRGSLGLLTS